MAYIIGDKNGKRWFFKTEYMHILQEKKLNSFYSEGYILLILRKEKVTNNIRIFITEYMFPCKKTKCRDQRTLHSYSKCALVNVQIQSKVCIHQSVLKLWV